MGYTLGIDIGTTYSAAAVARDGRSEVLSMGTDVASIPTVVVLREDGEVLVGEAAERRAVSEPGRVAREFKRRVGDPVPVIVGGTPYGVEALVGHVLRWIVARAAEQEGAAPDAICLTHPASWGTFKKDLLLQAARLADIGDVTLLTEPQAAALRYAQEGRVEPGAVVAVYDFGGGTFDAALVRSTGDAFELVGVPEGMERLGGIDFDQAVFAHVDQALDGMLRELDHDDPAVRAAVARLRTDCRRAKEALSSDTDTVIPVMVPSLQTEVRLTRAEFEAMIRPRVVETVDALGRAVRSADLGTDDLSAVLLVGGSSRIPLVGELVRESTGRPVTLDSHPKFTIALGAALHAERAAAGAATIPTPPVATPAEAEVSEPEMPEPAPAAVVPPPPPPPARPAAAEPQASGPPSAPSATPPAEPAGRSSRTPLLLGAGAAVVVLLVIVVLVLGGGGGDGDDAAATSTTTTTEGTTTTDATTSTESTTTTTGPTSSGYTTVSDASGSMTVELPTEWDETDVSTLFLYSSANPHISAAASLEGYQNSWTVEGISVIGVDLSEPGDVTTLLDDISAAFDYPSNCVLADSGPYADARLTGEYRVWQDCVGSGNETRLVAAGPSDASYVFLIGMQATMGADFSALDHALATVRLLGA